MTPDDPRHGTNRGYLAGCTEGCCRTAHADYRRHLRTRQYLAGGSLRVPTLGTHRRIQALMALGWPTPDIDKVIGRRPTYTANVLRCRDGQILRSTADLIGHAYDEMCMVKPTEDSLNRVQIVSRTRNLARRRGYVPPLGWNNIDDPDETPTGWAYTPSDRAVQLDELLADGAGLWEVLRALDVTQDTFQAWCGRHGHRDVYVRLSEAAHVRVKHLHFETERRAS